MPVIKLIIEVERGVTLTDRQKDLLREALAGDWVKIGNSTATRKLVMCLIHHTLVQDLYDFAVARGFDPILKKANKMDGTRLGFQVDEEGNITRDYTEVPANNLLPNLDISAAFPDIPRVDENGDPVMQMTYDENGDPAGEVQITDEYKPETYMGWA